MPIFLLLVFLGVPAAEITLFIQTSEQFGLWITIGLVILTAVFGTILLRHQGVQTLVRVQISLERGEMPVGELFEGLCLLVAGLLLLTPGFLTDAVGFTLFVPIVRSILAGVILQMLSRRGTNRPDTKFHTPPGGNEGSNRTIIDGDFTEVTDKPEKTSDKPITNHKNG